MTPEEVPVRSVKRRARQFRAFSPVRAQQEVGYRCQVVPHNSRGTRVSGVVKVEISWSLTRGGSRKSFIAILNCLGEICDILISIAKSRSKSRRKPVVAVSMTHVSTWRVQPRELIVRVAAGICRRIRATDHGHHIMSGASRPTLKRHSSTAAAVVLRVGELGRLTSDPAVLYTAGRRTD